MAAIAADPERPVTRCIEPAFHMLRLSDLIVLALIVLAGVCWWHDQGMRQLVLDACIRYCKDQEVQLLDQSVVLRRLWFRRDETRRLKFWRLYEFEFASAGDDRYKGRAITLGNRVLDIILEPYRVGSA